MSRDKQRLPAYLDHILEAIERIQRYTAGLEFSAYEMRNALAHGYFHIDHQIVWATVVRDLPNLKSLVGSLRDQFAK